MSKPISSLIANYENPLQIPDSQNRQEVNPQRVVVNGYRTGDTEIPPIPEDRPLEKINKVVGTILTVMSKYEQYKNNTIKMLNDVTGIGRGILGGTSLADMHDSIINRSVDPRIMRFMSAPDRKTVELGMQMLQDLINDRAAGPKGVPLNVAKGDVLRQLTGGDPNARRKGPVLIPRDGTVEAKQKKITEGSFLGRKKSEATQQLDRLVGKRGAKKKEPQGEGSQDMSFTDQKLDDMASPSAYNEVSDPYNILEKNRVPGYATLSDAVQALQENGWVTMYKDLSGFEMGSNHDWRVEIYPYPHEPQHKRLYQQLGRKSVTPQLPEYNLPNVWAVDRREQTVGGYELRTPPYVTVDGYDGSMWGNGFKKFSFSRDCPVLSYDLTLGSMRTMSLPLFNGSSSEVFAGMTYNATMSVSILDDIYNSMFKYMSNYVNCAYDVKSNSLAPYYNCAFQINLLIFRAAGKVLNHAFKFIGVPIEFTPRFEGTQGPQENIVSVSFGIIGFIPFQKSGESAYEASNRFKDSNLIGLMWDDIAPRMS